ncbi:ferrochelatase [Cavenderia fasciculata]|uniref:Ferrochelatase n=1 Tax=Cavenderia fasciculata TaxID=261658 RepID=F4PPB0_CACFS|nr:ferrochelatase [Cavenderia fasciculata]EGG22223.1 ferrochelatase [Cavenderia fasciculata]|eukprot:XP_004360074.1 ferrochelatase [Cavenderia fasciculata]
MNSLSNSILKNYNLFLLAAPKQTRNIILNNLQPSSSSLSFHNNNQLYTYYSSSLTCNNTTSTTIRQYTSSTKNQNNDEKQPLSSTTHNDIIPSKPKTAIVMLNLGGPQNLDEVEPFLTRLFSDRDIIKLPFQSIAGKVIAKRRTPAVRKLYEAIGGGSPIKKWTTLQGRAIEKILDARSPETAPHKTYIGFRYAAPLIDRALEEMKSDGVTRAIAFTQYPHYSCTTTGSSLNNLWKTLEQKGLERHFEWSIIDRWPLHGGFVNAITSNLEKAIEAFNTRAKELGMADEKPVIVFSAHSLPMKTVERGDPYPGEIQATVQAVMDRLAVKEGRPTTSDKYASILCWQSKVGPLPWLVPKTVDIVTQLAKENKNCIVVPVAFTSDHIETLSEIDIELQHSAKENGMRLMIRSESLNDNPLIIDAMADIVHQHLVSKQSISNPTKYTFKCPGCIDQSHKYCRTIRNPIGGGGQQPQQQQPQQQQTITENK